MKCNFPEFVFFCEEFCKKIAKKMESPPAIFLSTFFFLSPLDVHLRPLAPVSSASLVCDSALKGAVTWLFSDMTTN